MKGHDLHESSGADEASGPRVHLRLDEHHADYHRWIDLLFSAFGHDGIRDPIGVGGVSRVLADYLTDAECLFGRSGRAYHRGGKPEKLTGLFVFALVRNREERSCSEQDRKLRDPGRDAKRRKDAPSIKTGHLLRTLHELQARESGCDTR